MNSIKMVILKHIIMNEEFADIQYAPIKEYKYAPCFSEVQYNDYIV